MTDKGFDTENSAAYQRGLDWRRGRVKAVSMNWLQRLFHRHNFFPTVERWWILGDADLVDGSTVQHEVVGIVYVEVCSSCGTRRMKSYVNGKCVRTWAEAA